jgi:proline dehydrogenase
MTSPAAEGACGFAWRTYLLVHKGINENDDRRTALHRYVKSLSDAGEHDFDVLQVAAQMYLKKLDEFHEDGKARLAASQAIGRRSFEVGH